MKNITSHHDGFGLNDLIEIEASDEDANGVPHRIDFYRRLTQVEIDAFPKPLGATVDQRLHCGYLEFQKGPRGVNGEFYPCKNEIFRKTYEPVVE